jgi:hypothetical protein
MNFIETIQKFNFSNVIFYNKEHKYFNGDTQYFSVTRLLKQFSTFDSDSVSRFVAKAQNKTQDQVLHEWSSSGHKGTLSHEYIENKLKRKVLETVVLDEFKQYGLENSLEIIFGQIDNFIDDTKSFLVPIFSEFIVSDDDYLVAGTVDQIYYNLIENCFQIYDWKTSNGLTKKSSRKMNGDMNHIKDSKVNSYSLQTSIYKYILTKHTGLQFGDSFLTWFHEGNENYQIIKCEDFTTEAELILQGKKK